MAAIRKVPVRQFFLVTPTWDTVHLPCPAHSLSSTADIPIQLDPVLLPFPWVSVKITMTPFFVKN